ncbi:hypothetical protein BKI52_31870 [marine bacterium AO1-C]|nr:hypothetical protein BKI52_31870 [marine bacterium AO1-C]
MNIGFIGTGWTEKVQIQTYKKAGLRPYGIASGQYSNALKVQQGLDLPKAYQHWKELITDDNIEAVSIATPTFLHYEMAKFALKNNKLVICQAPLMNYSEAQNLLNYANQQKGKAKILFDFELRFVPVIQKLKQLIQVGLAGEIHWIELEYRHNFGLDSTAPYGWQNDLSKGGGVLNTIADHLIDLSQWLLNDTITEVMADSMVLIKERTDQHQLTQQATGDQHVQLLYTFGRQTKGRILTTALSAYQGIDVIVHGSKGSFHLKNGTLLSNTGEDFPNKRWQTVEVLDVAKEALGPELGNYLFANGTYHFARLLAQDSELLTNAASLREFAQVQQILDQAQASIQERVWKNVPLNR